MAKMPADLSKSVSEALTRGLKRARELAQAGQRPAAAEAYDRCADLAERYAGYAVNTAERSRRLRQAEEYRRLGAALRAAPSDEGAEPTAQRPTKVRADATTPPDEYQAAVYELIDRSSVTWDDIGGLDAVKDEIRMAYGLALAAQPEGVVIESGRNMLFYGPPGTGKTLLAAATSNGLDATFFNVRLSSMLSKYFGESTKLIEALYAVARGRAPSVVFFDEFDALTARRDAPDAGGAERRLLATILAALDGMAGKEKGPLVFTLAATNLPWMIDAAVLSRFDKRVYVPLPDAQVRRQILEMHITRRGHRLDDDLGRLVAQTEGLSGRRIAQLCRSAIKRVVAEENPGLLARVEKGQTALQDYQIRIRPLRLSDFDAALDSVSPEVTAEHLDRYRQWQEMNA